jgi:hypothetical protein
VSALELARALRSRRLAGTYPERRLAQHELDAALDRLYGTKSREEAREAWAEAAALVRFWAAQRAEREAAR